MPSLHRMLVDRRSRTPRLLAAAIASSVLLPGALASAAGAAPPPPQAAATCYGSLTGAGTVDQPFLTKYGFNCDSRITAYSILATRLPRNFDVIDGFSTTADVTDAQGNLKSDQSFGCEGGLPGNGFNCNSGAGSFMGALNYARGSFDLQDPYCKSLPTDAKSGTPATPQAIVQLVVTDTSGAQDGPFRLVPSSACPPVPDRAPQAKKKKKHHTTRHHGLRA